MLNGFLPRYSRSPHKCLKFFLLFHLQRAFEPNRRSVWPPQITMATAFMRWHIVMRFFSVTNPTLVVPLRPIMIVIVTIQSALNAKSTHNLPRSREEANLSIGAINTISRGYLHIKISTLNCITLLSRKIRVCWIVWLHVTKSWCIGAMTKYSGVLIPGSRHLCCGIPFLRCIFCVISTITPRI